MNIIGIMGELINAAVDPIYDALYADSPRAWE
jgi:hypothetical protein